MRKKFLTRYSWVSIILLACLACLPTRGYADQEPFFMQEEVYEQTEHLKDAHPEGQQAYVRPSWVAGLLGSLSASYHYVLAQQGVGVFLTFLNVGNALYSFMDKEKRNTYQGLCVLGGASFFLSFFLFFIPLCSFFILVRTQDQQEEQEELTAWEGCQRYLLIPFFIGLFAFQPAGLPAAFGITMLSSALIYLYQEEHERYRLQAFCEGGGSGLVIGLLSYFAGVILPGLTVKAFQRYALLSALASSQANLGELIKGFVGRNLMLMFPPLIGCLHVFLQQEPSVCQAVFSEPFKQVLNVLPLYASSSKDTQAYTFALTRQMASFLAGLFLGL